MWWKTHPVIYTLDNFEGHRIRFMAAEKAVHCATETLSNEDEAPEFMKEINPEGHYPVYVDRRIVCYGEPLEELLHERYPATSLLPLDPVTRAQVRMLSAEVRSWYIFKGYPAPLLDKLREFSESYDASLRFFCGGTMSAVDIAVAPLLAYATDGGWTISQSQNFARYVNRVLTRDSFLRSMLHKTEPMALTDPEEGEDE